MNDLNSWIVSARDVERRPWAKAALAAMLFGGCCVSAFGTGAAALADDAVVLHWNEIAVQAVGDLPPFPATRAMATVQVAVFEAVDAISRRYRPYRGTVVAAPGASAQAAAIVAAHDTLMELFPAQQRFLDERQAESLAAIAEGSAKGDGIAVGRSAAAAIIAERANDGSQAPMFYTPASAAPYAWQPTPSCANPPASGRGLFFHWQFVKPFGVETSAQFRAEPPPALASDRYAKDLNEVAGVGAMTSTVRPSGRGSVATFYAAQFPHRGWNLVARQLAAEHGADEITRTARTLAILNMSLSDAHVTVFESKYRYVTWRPETAIASAEDGGNGGAAPAVRYQPFVPTPCFPGYPSAHGAGGGAGRVALERAYGRQGHDITVSDNKAPGIVLSYSDLRTITDDVADARVYGGIHFRYDQDAGDRMGAAIARYNDEHWLLPLDSSEHRVSHRTRSVPSRSATALLHDQAAPDNVAETFDSPVQPRECELTKGISTDCLFMD